MTDAARRASPREAPGVEVPIRSLADDPAAALPLDPDLRVVKLHNGFTIWIKRHRRPPGAAALGLFIGSGSLVEQDDELGAAHFLEHMAFRGTANYPPGAVQRLFASLGTRLGTHHNATTSLDHTSFTMFLPEASGATLDAMVLCLADFAYRLSLLPTEVERERRVILEELRAFPEAGARLRRRLLAALFPASRLAERLPLGRPETVRSLTPQRLRRHLEKWHRPDNSCLLAVGDVDPDAIETLVRRHFDGWPGAPVPPPAADPGVLPLEALRATVIREPELSEGEVRAIAVLPPHPMRTVGDFRTVLEARLGLWLVHRRLASLVRLGEAPFRDFQLDLSPLLRACVLARASAVGPVDRVEDMLACLLTELKRAGSHTVAAGELARGRAAMLTAARQAVVAEGNRGCDSLLAELEESMVEGRDPLGKAQAAELVEALLPEITGLEVRDRVAACFLRPAKLLAAIVPGRQPEGHEPCDHLLRLHREVEGKAVARPRSRRVPRALMPRRPRPGRIAARDDSEETGVVSATLANGVRVHVREMAYRADRVFVSVTVAGGRIRETPASLGLTQAAALAYSQPATPRMSSVVIDDLLAGRTAIVTAQVDEDALALSLASDRASLETGLQLVHLLLTEPRIEAAALRRWQERIRDGAETQRQSLEVNLAERALRLLSGADPRFALLSAEAVGAITLDGAQRWLDQAIRPSPLEASLVGDLPVQRLLDLACRYLGSLPARAVCDPTLTQLRRLSPAPGPLESVLTVDAASPAAAVLVGWRATPWQAARDRHLLQVGEQVLVQRVRRELRELRGLSYSPEVSFTPSKAYPDGSLLAASSYAPPERVRETAEIVQGVVAAFAAEGPTAAEVATVRKHLTDLAARSLRDPKFWSRSLADLDYHGGSLTDLASLADTFAGFTAGEVLEVLARTVTDERRLTVICLPARGA